jgi:hypothetical protein
LAFNYSAIGIILGNRHFTWLYFVRARKCQEIESIWQNPEGTRISPNAHYSLFLAREFLLGIKLSN